MNPVLNPTLVVDGTGLQRVGAFLSRVAERSDPAFGLDLETNMVEDRDFLNRRIRTIQVGDRDEQYVIDLLAFADGNPLLLDAEQGWRKTSPCFAPVVDTLRPFLDSDKTIKVGHSLQFEYEMLSWNLGLYPWNMWCTYLAEKVRWAGYIPFKMRGFWGLKDLIKRYLRVEISKEAQTSFNLTDPLTLEQVIYAALDVRLPLGVRAGQIKVLTADRLMQTMWIENHAIPAFGDMHVTGFYLDANEWTELANEVKAEHKINVAEMDKHFLAIAGPKKYPTPPEELAVLEARWRDLGVDSPEELEVKAQMDALTGKGSTAAKVPLREKKAALKTARVALKKAAGEAYMEANKYATWWKKEGVKMEGAADINYGSPTQLLEVLKKIPGLKALKDTNNRSLAKYKDHPVVKATFKYRKSGKKLESFGENYLDFINPLTGRIHAIINQIGAMTGRTSSEKPNIQQIPKDKKYRNKFKARPGYVMCTLDYDGCELRIMCDASGEPLWIEAFNKRWDIHSVVAAMMRAQEWAAATIKEAFTVVDEKTGKETQIPVCAFIYGNSKGQDHVKCDCPGHQKLRGDSKSVNFGTAYGLMARGLADQLDITEEEAQVLLDFWHASNPTLSKALMEWAEQTWMTGESRTLGDRRRLFRKPTWEDCKEKVRLDLADKAKKCKTDEDRKKYLREPYQKEIMRKYKGIKGGIMREGCNHKIQGTNKDFVALAIGSGHDENGKPYFWHYSRPDKNQALLCNLVHDEIVFESPEEKHEEAYDTAGDCMVRAGQRYIKKIPVLYDGHKAPYWTK